jgi:serine phosphatase RsbU (regulator of sigma subunit)
VIKDTKKKICVIDDEAPIRMVLAKALGEEYHVEGFESAEDALLYGIRQFDLVLSDVRLPGKSGLELIGEIKEFDDSLPVILMTGMSDFNTAVSAIREGASDFIVKPFIIEQLLVSVHRAMERHILMMENKRLFNEIAAKNVQLEDLNQVVNARNAQMESDIDIACNLLESIFPKLFPEINGVIFDFRMSPYEKISGDFFEVTPMEDGKFMFIIADVCGHGVPAALYSALVKSTMMVKKEQFLSTADFITRINSYLISSHKMMIYTYVALFCGIFDMVKCELTYCNAGIPAPLFLKSDGEHKRLESTGTVVGIFSGAEFEEERLHFEKKDKFLFFTDGAFEGLPVPATQKGYENLVKSVVESVDCSVSEIVEKTFRRLYNKDGKSIIRDDVTIIGVGFDE